MLRKYTFFCLSLLQFCIQCWHLWQDSCSCLGNLKLIWRRGRRRNALTVSIFWQKHCLPKSYNTQYKCVSNKTNKKSQTNIWWIKYPFTWCWNPLIELIEALNRQTDVLKSLVSFQLLAFIREIAALTGSVSIFSDYGSRHWNDDTSRWKANLLR